MRRSSYPGIVLSLIAVVTIATTLVKGQESARPEQRPVAVAEKPMPTNLKDAPNKSGTLNPDNSSPAEIRLTDKRKSSAPPAAPQFTGVSKGGYLGERKSEDTIRQQFGTFQQK
jgi:hypothetical protein